MWRCLEWWSCSRTWAYICGNLKFIKNLRHILLEGKNKSHAVLYWTVRTPKLGHIHEEIFSKISSYLDFSDHYCGRSNKRKNKHFMCLYALIISSGLLLPTSRSYANIVLFPIYSFKNSWFYESFFSFLNALRKHQGILHI